MNECVQLQFCFFKVAFTLKWTRSCPRACARLRKISVVAVVRRILVPVAEQFAESSGGCFTSHGIVEGKQ